MKLFLASALAALSAKNASAWRIVRTMDDTYCIMVVPYDSTVWTGALSATPATATAANGDGPTVGPNGVNDPNGDILSAAQAVWGAGAHTATASITYYEAGGTTAMSPQPDTLTPPPTLTPETSGLGFCKFYSTTAPSHYCKADGAYDTWQQANWGDTIDDCCTNNHASEYNACFEASAGVVSSFPLFLIICFQFHGFMVLTTILSLAPPSLLPLLHNHSPPQQTQRLGSPTTPTKCATVYVTWTISSNQVHSLLCGQRL
jgi:hypothetical protein